MIIFSIMLSFGFVACKKEVILKNELNNNSGTMSYKKPSLEEFKKYATSDGEKEFFRNNKIKNLNNSMKKFIDLSKSKRSSDPNEIFPVARPRFKLFWGGSGCVNPIGGCIIIPLVNTNDSSNVDLVKVDNNLIIFPTHVENGLTSDGYFPIYTDLDIPSEIVNELNLSYSKIKSGIYQAYYDSTQNKYSGVVVELK